MVLMTNRSCLSCSPKWWRCFKKALLQQHNNTTPLSSVSVSLKMALPCRIRTSHLTETYQSGSSPDPQWPMGEEAFSYFSCDFCFKIFSFLILFFNLLCILLVLFLELISSSFTFYLQFFFFIMYIGDISYCVLLFKLFVKNIALFVVLIFCTFIICVLCRVRMGMGVWVCVCVCCCGDGMGGRGRAGGREVRLREMVSGPNNS